MMYASNAGAAAGVGQPSASQPDLLEHGLETRLGAQRVEVRLDLEVNEQTPSLFLHPLQPSDRRGMVAHAHAELCQRPMRPVVRLAPCNPRL